MTQEDIIRMAEEAGKHLWPLETKFLLRFAALVAAAEREKSLQLWMLLDDVDTADDIAKTDEVIYRSLCRQAHAKRWSLLNGDEVDAAIRARGQKIDPNKWAFDNGLEST
jgi:2-phospho-L-lactate guanylyltransferase (CobY/MobA/RfbA family)